MAERKTAANYKTMITGTWHSWDILNHYPIYNYYPFINNHHRYIDRLFLLYSILNEAALQHVQKDLRPAFLCGSTFCGCIKQSK